MKRAYLLYILTGLVAAFLAVSYLGASNGFSGYLPIGALFGAMLLLVIAAPSALYHPRLSLYFGCAGILLILPYISGFTMQFFLDFNGKLHWSIMLILCPAIMLLISLIFSIRMLMYKDLVAAYRNNYLRLLFASIPILTVLLYLIFYGNEWSWQIFMV